ncbi:MAG: hypothetical protein ACRC1D_03365 [Culicoidibacterales bacterium]
MNPPPGFQPLPPPGSIDPSTENGQKALDVWIAWNFILVPQSETQALTLAQLFQTLINQTPTIWSWNESENVQTLIDTGLIRSDSMMAAMQGFGDDTTVRSANIFFPNSFPLQKN